jgi:serine/threonine protein kinase
MHRRLFTVSTLKFNALVILLTIECVCVAGDLSCRNLLVDDQYKVKVSDFGLARSVESGEYQVKDSEIPSML